MHLHLNTPPSWFAHVAKTGGVSLGTIIENAYDSTESIRINPPKIAKLTISDLRRFRCFHDYHHGRGMFDLVGRSDLVVITMLREPVERTVSQIRYFQRMAAELPRTFLPEYLTATQSIRDSDLTRPLDPEALALVCDSQIGMFGIIRDCRPLFAGSADAESGRSVLRPYPFEILSEDEHSPAALDRARKWLAEMDVVGIHEHFNESVQLVCSRLGVPVPASLPRANRNPLRADLADRYRSHLPTIVVEQIEEFTRRDRELYEFALERFREQWARHLSRPARHFSIAPRLRRLKRSAGDAARDMLKRTALR